MLLLLLCAAVFRFLWVSGRQRYGVPLHGDGTDAIRRSNRVRSKRQLERNEARRGTVILLTWNIA